VGVEEECSMVLSDEDIKKEIVDDLYWDTSIDASKVQVKVDNGQVTLSGTVRSYAELRRAEDAACRITDVIWVNNQLIVMLPPAVTVPDDADIRQTVLNYLSENPDLDMTDIRVAARIGIVTLEGSVDEYWKKYEAECLASRARGVVDVVNEITVVPTMSIADKAIADDVRAAIERNFNVDIEDVTIEVEDGVVTLSGAVPNWAARQAALTAAERTAGVVDVIDNLVYRAAPAMLV
jgi:osmotically-inducible protein OsmY